MSQRGARGDDATLAAIPDTALPSSGATPTPAGEREIEGAAKLAGRYELLGLLGVGGMGSVYRARDLELDELVALKMLRRELVGTIEALERFRREVKLARRVTHTNVARTFDIGEHAGERFLTMELVEGSSLARVIAERGALPITDVVRIGACIADGLESAHAVSVVHRDLKPDNVLLAKDGRVVITDFGIARAGDAAGRTGAGQVVGTPAYMAPEQVEAKAVDARADLYALGLVLYEMITGERAWPGEAAFAVAAARLVRPPPDPSARRLIPPALATLVRACMSRDPAGRPESAARVATELRALEQVPAAVSLAPSAPAFDRAIDRTLLVAPLRDSAVAEDRWIAEGLAEDLTDALSMVSGLRVRAHAHASEGLTEAREIGRQAGVDVVVDGSVRRSGDALRISLRLLSVRDGFQLWARRFEGRIGDLLTINDDAARAIAAALTDTATRPREAPADADAVELYLRARSGLNTMFEPAYEAAVALLDRALALAPNNPVILAERAWTRMSQTFRPGTSEELMATALREATLALELGPMLGEPWVALAHVRNNSNDTAGAVVALRRAVKNAPSLARAHDLLGRIMLEAGLFDAAIHHLERAIWLDPAVLVFPYIDLVRAHALRGDDERRDRALTRLRERSKLHHRLLASRLGMWRDARFETDPYLPNAHRRNVVVSELHDAVMEHHALTLEQTRELDDLGAQPGVGSRARRLFHQVRAEIAASLGDGARTRDSIEQSVGFGLMDLAWMDRCPVLTASRDEPWFRAQRAIVAARVQPVIEAYAKLDEPD